MAILGPRFNIADATLATIIGIGLLAGFFIGSAGVGGGVIVAPALTYFANIEPKLAISTALMGFGLSGIIGTLRYRQKGSISWSSACILAMAAVPATIAGALATHEMSPSLLKGLVGMAVLLAGLQIKFARTQMWRRARVRFPPRESRR